MNIDITVTSMVSAIAPIGTLAVIVYGIFNLRKTLHETPFFFDHRAREEHKFARDFLKELKANPDMHPYARITGLRVISGNPEDDPEMVEYLISLEQPPNAMRAFNSGRTFVTYESAGKTMQFRQEYAGKIQQMHTRRSRVYFFFNLGWAAPFFAPLILALLKMPVWPTLDAKVPALVFYELIMMMGYILSLRAVDRLRQATRLVENQKPFDERPAPLQIRRLTCSSRSASLSR